MIKILVDHNLNDDNKKCRPLDVIEAVGGKSYSPAIVECSNDEFAKFILSKYGRYAKRLNDNKLYEPVNESVQNEVIDTSNNTNNINEDIIENDNIENVDEKDIENEIIENEENEPINKKESFNKQKNKYKNNKKK